MTRLTWPANIGPMDLLADGLPDPLPENPFVTLEAWLEQARIEKAVPNPNSMVLATVGEDANPSARVVLCKALDVAAGALTFHTNYDSRKGAELARNPRAAVVFHWDHQNRQVRIEGRVAKLADGDNDRYFSSRAWQSKLGAWASEQSRPVDSLARLKQQLAAAARRFGLPYPDPGTPAPTDLQMQIPRPPFWGGYSLLATAVELWVEGRFRIHERVRWTREGAPGPWTVTRLQP
jgi:pyridoxamine 5'-phosphate oxidase